MGLQGRTYQQSMEQARTNPVIAIPLRRGSVVLAYATINAVNLKRVMDISPTWSIGHGGYAVAINRPYVNGKQKMEAFSMHRIVAGAPNGISVDHINGNPLDNTTENLRFISPTNNAQKMYRIKPKSSRFKGASWNRDLKKWQANIRVDGKLRHLGYFTSEIDAGLAYDEAATTHFGLFANHNGLLAKTGKNENAPTSY